jgi:hypothetical protein
MPIISMSLVIFMQLEPVALSQSGQRRLVAGTCTFTQHQKEQDFDHLQSITNYALKCANAISHTFILPVPPNNPALASFSKLILTSNQL